MYTYHVISTKKSKYTYKIKFCIGDKSAVRKQAKLLTAIFLGLWKTDQSVFLFPFLQCSKTSIIYMFTLLKWRETIFKNNRAQPDCKVCLSWHGSTCIFISSLFPNQCGEAAQTVCKRLSTSCILNRFIETVRDEGQDLFP